MSVASTSFILLVTIIELTLTETVLQNYKEVENDFRCSHAVRPNYLKIFNQHRLNAKEEKIQNFKKRYKREYPQNAITTLSLFEKCRRVLGKFWRCLKFEDYMIDSKGNVDFGIYDTESQGKTRKPWMEVTPMRGKKTYIKKIKHGRRRKKRKF
uniref:Uncharacterized protein n=1 Tax=Clastoptera arizonana TaxID=38151 RepID=A0A1B6DKP8_9HEMI